MRSQDSESGIESDGQLSSFDACYQHVFGANTRPNMQPLTVHAIFRSGNPLRCPECYRYRYVMLREVLTPPFTEMDRCCECAEEAYG